MWTTWPNVQQLASTTCPASNPLLDISFEKGKLSNKALIFNVKSNERYFCALLTGHQSGLLAAQLYHYTYYNIYVILLDSQMGNEHKHSPRVHLLEYLVSAKSDDYQFFIQASSMLLVLLLTLKTSPID